MPTTNNGFTSSAKMENDEIEIDLQELIAVMIQWLWLIASCAIVTAIIGFAISSFVIAPEYDSTTRVYILNSSDDKSLTYSDTQLATQLTKDFGELITSRNVLEQVIDNAGLDCSAAALKKQITVSNKSDTRIIDIKVRDKDPVMAQQLANMIREVSSEKIKVVMDIKAINVVDEANLPTDPSEPSVKKWTAIGFMFGFIVCAGIITIRFLLDDTIKSSEDVEKYLGLSTLALIPNSNTGDKKKFIGKSDKSKGQNPPARSERAPERRRPDKDGDSADNKNQQ